MALGVPAAHMDAYEVLGIHPETPESGIKHAYRRRSLEWHPDRWSRFSDAYISRANYLFSLVTTAYQQLTQARHSRHSMEGDDEPAAANNAKTPV